MLSSLNINFKTNTTPYSKYVDDEIGSNFVAKLLSFGAEVKSSLLGDNETADFDVSVGAEATVLSYGK